MQSPYTLPKFMFLDPPMMSFVTWLDIDSVYTLFAMRQPLGITGLPQIVVRQMVLSRMGNMSPSIVHTPGGLSAQEICPLVLSDRSLDVYFFIILKAISFRFPT